MVRLFKDGKLYIVEDPFNGHEYVDLGLPSGTLWATCNVGANSPEEYGDYFAFGETEPKEFYAWETYKWGNGETNIFLTKYCTNSDWGIVDNKTILDKEDDAAFVNWGGNWRTPTPEEFQELMDYCAWSTSDFDGFKVVGPNGNSIILPFGGMINSEFPNGIGKSIDGYYWTNHINTALETYSGYYGEYKKFITLSQETGLKIRPVMTGVADKQLYLDSGRLDDSILK